MKPDDDESGEKRNDERSNVFLSATLHDGHRSVPVRIRNLSGMGALVDGEGFPAAGVRISLARGELQVPGIMARSIGTSAGLSFDSAIDVEAWVKRVGHSGQQGVDGMISVVRNSDVKSSSKRHGRQTSLVELSRALDESCEQLARIDTLVRSHGEELMKLDSIAQALRRLATGSPY